MEEINLKYSVLKRSPKRELREDPKSYILDVRPSNPRAVRWQLDEDEEEFKRLRIGICAMNKKVCLFKNMSFVRSCFMDVQLHMNFPDSKNYEYTYQNYYVSVYEIAN